MNPALALALILDLYAQMQAVTQQLQASNEQNANLAQENAALREHVIAMSAGGPGDGEPNPGPTGDGVTDDTAAFSWPSAGDPTDAPLAPAGP